MECKRIRALAVFCRWTLVALVALACTTLARAMVSSEYELKAVFLLNFVQFVEWPDEAFVSERDFLAVCVLGADPFGVQLDAIMDEQTLAGRTIGIRRVRDPQHAHVCHLLFVSGESDVDLDSLLSQLRRTPVLTVGESEGFIEAGGMIRFQMEGNRVRLQINNNEASAANLRVSSKLLRNSRLVSQASS